MLGAQHRGNYSYYLSLGVILVQLDRFQCQHAMDVVGNPLAIRANADHFCVMSHVWGYLPDHFTRLSRPKRDFASWRTNGQNAFCAEVKAYRGRASAEGFLMLA